MLAGAAPIPAAVQLTLTPSQVAPAARGTVETFTLTTANANGVVFANTNATVTITGPNQQTRTVTTDATGQVNFSCADSSFNAGTQPIQTPSTIIGSRIASTVVNVTWNNGTKEAWVVSAGPY